MRKQIKIALLLCLCLGLNACRSDSLTPEKKEVPLTPVTAEQPKLRDIELYVEAVGVLEPSFEVDIRPQQGGVIEKILVKEGDSVIEGTPLFQIASRSLESRVKEAKAQLLVDEAAYQTAKKKRDRFQSLAEKDLVAQVEWDEIEMQAIRAEAILDFDRAKLEAAQLDLQQCTLYAPSSGILGRIDFHQGTLVSVGEILTSLTRTDPLVVNFSLTEKEFAKLPRGQVACRVQSLCGKGCFVSGNITYIDHRFDSRSGLIFLRGEIQNSEHSLRPGQSVSVRVPVATLPGKIVISSKVVKYNQQGPYVYVVNPQGTLEFRQLTLGDEDSEDVIVEGGISLDEQVVTSGYTRLSPGLQVEVQP